MKKTLDLPSEKFEGFIPLFNKLNLLLNIKDKKENHITEGDQNE